MNLIWWAMIIIWTIGFIMGFIYWLKWNVLDDGRSYGFFMICLIIFISIPLSVLLSFVFGGVGLFNQFIENLPN